MNNNVETVPYKSYFQVYRHIIIIWAVE